MERPSPFAGIEAQEDEQATPNVPPVKLTLWRSLSNKLWIMVLSVVHMNISHLWSREGFAGRLRIPTASSTLRPCEKALPCLKMGVCVIFCHAFLYDPYPMWGFPCIPGTPIGHSQAFGFCNFLAARILTKNSLRYSLEGGYTMTCRVLKHRCLRFSCSISCSFVIETVNLSLKSTHPTHPHRHRRRRLSL